MDSEDLDTVFGVARCQVFVSAAEARIDGILSLSGPFKLQSHFFLV